MDKTRRDFLKGTAWMGITAAAAGCMSNGFRLTPGGSMMGWADKPIEKLRVGVIGLGMRGPGAVHILAMIPGVEVTALCDKHPERVEQQQQWLRDNGHRPAPKTFSGEDGYTASSKVIPKPSRKKAIGSMEFFPKRPLLS